MPRRRHCGGFGWNASVADTVSGRICNFASTVTRQVSGPSLFGFASGADVPVFVRLQPPPNAFGVGSIHLPWYFALATVSKAVAPASCGTP